VNELGAKSLDFNPEYSSRAGIAFWGAILAAGAPLVFLMTGTTATLLTPGYSSLSSPISALADPQGPYPRLISVGFIAYGSMVQGLGLAFYASSNRQFTKLTLGALVLLYGIGGIAAGIFVTGQTEIVAFGLSEGDLHGGAAWVTLGAIMSLMAAGVFVRPLGGDSSKLRKGSLTLLLLTASAVLAFVLTPEFAFSGLLQRGFFVTTMVWVFISAIHIAQQLSQRTVTR